MTTEPLSIDAELAYIVARAQLLRLTGQGLSPCEARYEVREAMKRVVSRDVPSQFEQETVFSLYDRQVERAYRDVFAEP